MTSPLVSPTSGRPLVADTAHSLADGAGERWPLVDGIVYLRTQRDALKADVLALLDEGHAANALIRLLADQDEWWTGPEADPAQLARLVGERDRLSFREAMGLLAFGRVGDYLAHRWSDPTFLAGLALMEAHWAQPNGAFELACGTGAYLRELARCGVTCTGGDVVFAKLWLARHWIVGPAVELICFDAAAPWPIAGRKYETVLCHDAFYFLEPKRTLAMRLREAVAPGGMLALAHVHNARHPNLSSGAALTAAELKDLFPDALVYDDHELTCALREAREPTPAPLDDLEGAEAFSLVLGDIVPARPLTAGLAMPRADARLCKNPLYDADDAIRWPSERYRMEYAARATYPMRASAPDAAERVRSRDAQARSRELVDLPERW